MSENNQSKVTAPSITRRVGGETVCSIGFFDGVHRGHKYLVRQVLDEARERGARSLLVTFDRHPRSLFAPATAPQLLTSHAEKMELLRQTGVDDVCVLDFNHTLATLTARDFMAEVLQQMGVTTLVIGYDHHFGRPQGETFEDYAAYGRELGIDVVQARELEGGHVSSSAIRRALSEGRVELAAELLGRPYTWAGRVVHGYGIGRRLGFPTANLEADEPQKMLPGGGAYAVHAEDLGANDPSSDISHPTRKPGMLNIGCRPTLDNGSDVSVEVHLFDTHADIYGHRLRLTFAAHLRSEQRFTDEQALAEQLARDAEAAREILSAQK